MKLGGLKYDSGMDKTPWDLLPMDALEGMARVLLYGKRKYTVCNECETDGKPTKVYPNPRLDGDLPRNDCPVCGSTNIEEGANNWRKGFKWTRLIASAFRHLRDINKGILVDEESGELHAFHLLCCSAFLAEHMIYKLGINDIFQYGDSID